MAGIGFKMQKLFKEDYFSARVRAYGFAVLITAGPWLVVVVTLALVQWLIGMAGVTMQVRELFLASISYCFIFSQVIFGVQNLIVTRYIADLFYEKRSDEVYPTFLGASQTAIGLGIILWCVFAIFSPLPFLYKLLLLILLSVMNVIWILFLFLTAAKYYQPIAYSFILGGAASLGATALLIYLVEFSQYSVQMNAFLLLAAFTFGMVVTLFVLYFSLLISFPKRSATNPFTYLTYFDRYPSLFWTGFLYNAGVWGCNWIIWFGEGASYIEGSFRYHTLYDTAVFLAYLSIIPTMMLFVLSIETRFYQRYRTFYGYINEGGSLQQIKRAKETMQIVLRQELERLLRNQGLFSILVMATIVYFAERFGIQQPFFGMLCITIVGAFANAMVLVISLLLLYFEDRKGAMYTSIIFFTSNILLTLLCMPLGLDGYGLSFAISSILTFVYTSFRLTAYVKDIDFHTFMGDKGAAERKTSYFHRLGRFFNRLGL
ncbi:exopolysaccharide Pel transporter PelG [Ectobacillus sp. JY-23]|uniref:exopolysaccharide Pel transporter PelG n=1 Tax=Ectobacillus sp. JY-23 TaxID=2933872 RepID=UPI001FF140FA|nr:exopolysaccharide Pel transporter PelG [Ectobacillus sp. JY-23]UOY92220.1 exopolysaccharide Pel transporter PelG [Ectobacillus sp. JY-23]